MFLSISHIYAGTLLTTHTPVLVPPDKLQACQIYYILVSIISAYLKSLLYKLTNTHKLNSI